MKSSWPNHNPGALRYQIVWQRKLVSGQNSFGEDVYTWETVVSCMADVTGLSGRHTGQEVQGQQQRWAEAEFHVTQNYSRGLLTTDRIAWNDDGTTRYLDVLSIEDREGRRMVQDVYAKVWIP